MPSARSFAQSRRLTDPSSKRPSLNVQLGNTRKTFFGAESRQKTTKTYSFRILPSAKKAAGMEDLKRPSPAVRL